MRRLSFLLAALLFLAVAIVPRANAEIVQIATWNMEWFPGGKPSSTEMERALHMSAAKDGLLEIKPDILCAQEVRDWAAVEEVTSVLPNFQPLIVSRFRQMGKSGSITIQQTAIAANRPAESAWSESFASAPVSPPRGFSFAAIPFGETVLLLYSVHFKSNRGGISVGFPKREEAARQVVAHAAEMEKLYSARKVVTVIAGDFNTDPTDSRFAGERTFSLLNQKYQWAWKGLVLEDRITVPAHGKYPDACFDGFFVRGGRIMWCKPFPVARVSDHVPTILALEIK
ncbi:MAG TPA: endonuclease/exonuclease/phosphatase family protein [Chthoniobacterales bacterium]